jgi:F-type H+-transporting ATPase subunit delta
MANVSIARRYARALIDVAAESNKLDQVGEQLRSFVEALSSSTELNDLLVNPAYSRAQRVAVVEAITMAQGGVEPEVSNFLKLAVDRNRMLYLPDIARLYRDLADQRANRVRGKVTTAVPMSAAGLEKLAHVLAGVTERNVVLETKVDPELLGGVSAQVGSVMYDGSLRTQLEGLRRELTRR